MKPINLELDSLTIRGQLFDEYPDVAELDQDLLEVDLPNGLTVSVGWFPECDPNGQFRITTFDRYWTNRVGDIAIARTPQEAAEAVKRIASEQALRTPVTTA